MRYRIIDKITSDVMFEAYGKDKKELFTNAAEALFGVICEIKKVELYQSTNFHTKSLSDSPF